MCCWCPGAQPTLAVISPLPPISHGWRAMPTLNAEPDLFPEQLFADEVRSAHQSAAWWVLHTRPRQEKSLARQLVDARLPFYLPLVARRSLVRGRVANA